MGPSKFGCIHSFCSKIEELAFDDYTVRDYCVDRYGSDILHYLCIWAYLSLRPGRCCST